MVNEAFFGESWLWHIEHSSALHLSFLNRVLNSRSFFSFPRSKQVPDSFLDERYLTCHVNTNRHKLKKKKNSVLLLSFIIRLLIISHNTTDFKKLERERGGISYDSLLIPTSLLDSGNQTLLIVRVDVHLLSDYLSSVPPLDEYGTRPF